MSPALPGLLAGLLSCDYERTGRFEMCGTDYGPWGGSSGSPRRGRSAAGASCASAQWISSRIIPP